LDESGIHEIKKERRGVVINVKESGHQSSVYNMLWRFGCRNFRGAVIDCDALQSFLPEVLYASMCCKYDKTISSNKVVFEHQIHLLNFSVNFKSFMHLFFRCGFAEQT